MRESEREDVLRAAEALWLRGKALADRADRLEAISRLPLAITALVVDERADGERFAIINGSVVAHGAELEGVTVVEIVRSCVRFRLDDTEFVRELGQ